MANAQKDTKLEVAKETDTIPQGISAEVTAPKVAPEEIPIMPESAKGFLKNP